MDPLDKSRIGKTDLYVTRLGLGCSGLARSESYQEAAETFRTAVTQGINYVDTAPLYGLGLSEIRIGKILTEIDRTKLVISTKVGRIIHQLKSDRNNKDNTIAIYDYSNNAVKKSLQSSLERMNVDTVDILFIHGPDNHYKTAIEEAYPTLLDLRDNEVVKAIGAGMNQWEMELRFAQEGNFDCFLLANRYTLLEQEAIHEFLPYCQKHNISVIIGGPYNSGILANPTSGRYEYGIPPKKIIKKTLSLKRICDKYHVPLKAAALQFVLAHPAVVSVIPGTKSPEHQINNLKMMKHDIPNDLWKELREQRLLNPKAPVPT
jgi:D-threo-aldose 1-dehydrogenase